MRSFTAGAKAPGHDRFGMPAVVQHPRVHRSRCQSWREGAPESESKLSLSAVFISEVVGTGMLMLLGCGVVANNLLPKNKGKGTGFLFVNLGWGLAVFSGVLVSGASSTLPAGRHVTHTTPPAWT